MSCFPNCLLFSAYVFLSFSFGRFTVAEDLFFCQFKKSSKVFNTDILATVLVPIMDRSEDVARGGFIRYKHKPEG